VGDPISVEGGLAIEDIGAALAATHLQRGDRIDVLRRADAVQEIEAIGDSLVELDPKWQSIVEEIKSSFMILLEKTQIGPTPVHGDFYSDQIIRSPNGDLHILDFDEACIDHPYFDLGNFVAHLLINELTLASNHEIDEIEKRIIDGYEFLCGGISRWEYDLQKARALFRLSQKPFRQRTNSWSNKIEAILKMVADLQAKINPNLFDPIAPKNPLQKSRDSGLPHLAVALQPNVIETHLRSQENMTLKC